MGTRSVNAEIMDINRLSDADLYHMLISYGVEIGPVVASTRFLYEKKLQQLIHSDKSDVTYYKPEATLSPQLPSSPPVISEPEVSFNDYPETESPMRTEVADGGPRPNTAFSAGTPVIFETVNPEPERLIQETKEIREILLEQKSHFTPSGATTFDRSVEGADAFRTPLSEIRGRRALRSHSPSPSIHFSGFGNGIRSQTKGSTPKTGKSHLQQAQSKDGSRSRIALIIEVAVITFLIVVGYLFYQEMQTLDEAVKNGQTEL